MTDTFWGVNLDQVDLPSCLFGTILGFEAETKMRILAVEDEKQLAELLRFIPG
jgi:hypothetical protein